MEHQFLPNQLLDYNDQLLLDLVLSDDNIVAFRNALAKQNDPNRVYHHGCTLLHIAARSDHDNPGIVQELINAGADVCRLDDTSSTALHFAVKHGKRKVVDLLLQTTIPINQKNDLGITALNYAINKYVSNIPGIGTDMYIVRKLLDHRLISVNEADSYQQTPLVLAIKNDHFEIVKMLLIRNARVDTFHDKRHTPLHRALFSRDHRFVVALLLKQASVLEMDESGETPLNIIINLRSVAFACTCLKVMAFNYNLEVPLTNEMIPNPELWQFLNKCWDEIDYMKKDIIVSDLTVFDFFSKCAAKHGFDKPISKIYKPVVEKLLTGKYPVYIEYILNRMSKSTLHAVLEACIQEKYDNKPCAMEHLKDFSIIIQNHLLYEYLSYEEIFYLIVAFTDKTESEHLLYFHDRKWYLTDLWDVYPNDHFS